MLHQAFVKSPGEIFIAELSHFRAARTPGSPGAPQSPRKKPRKTVIFIGGVWEFRTLHAAPGSPASTKNRGLLRFITGGVWEFPGRPQGPGDLSRGYPQVIHIGEFGSFT